jgi:uncharacterized membrane protein
MPKLPSPAKDHLAALMLIALGAFALALGMTYRIGSLNRMGAGYIPMVLGILMVLVGIAIGVTSTPASRAATKAAATANSHTSPYRGPEWRGWVCIIGGVVAFVILGQYGGLVPATFMSVFIAALGDRNNTVKSSAVLAVILVVFGTLVFHFGLKLPLQLFHWG